MGSNNSIKTFQTMTKEKGDGQKNLIDKKDGKKEEQSCFEANFWEGWRKFVFLGVIAGVVILVIVLLTGGSKCVNQDAIDTWAAAEEQTMTACEELTPDDDDLITLCKEAYTVLEPPCWEEEPACTNQADIDIYDATLGLFDAACETSFEADADIQTCKDSWDASAAPTCAE